MAIAKQENERALAEPTTVEKLRGLPWSIASNAANTVFVQYTFFGSVFVLFLNSLNLDKAQIGFLLSLLPFAGLISIFAAGPVQRLGYKRTYIIFWTLRTVASLGLLATPWIIASFGAQTTLTFLATTVAIFALLRSVGMTASLPWVQQYVPDAVRGKYTATNNIFTSVTGFVAVLLGGFVLNRVAGLTGFMLLIGTGIVAGFVCAWLASFIPGGAPEPVQAGKKRQRDLGVALRDRRYVRYLLGVGVLTLATVPLGSFVPLFIRDEVGIAQGNVVMLQIGTLSGSILFSYAWGWAADRYGSKPVMLWGLLLRSLLPLLWLSMPRQSEWSLMAAFGIALLQGAADIGWGIGSARLLYAGIVPALRRSDYLALYNAWTGIVGGISQLAGGWLIAAFAGLSGQFLIFEIDQYLPLFVLGMTLPIVSLVVLNAIRADETVGLGEFAGIFFRGNPFLAMTSMMRFHLARSEQTTVRMTERLSVAKSPLVVDELLEALKDPRFNVRFEAVVSIARMPADPRLTASLVEILHGSELALSVVAAWALGRIADPDAYDALRDGLDSDYRSIQAHSARALGSLGNSEIVPLLLERLATETDKGLQMAYASALGNLAAVDAAETLLDLLGTTTNEGARLELALNLTRIVGDEQRFVQLLRGVRTDPGTTLAQELTSLRRRLIRSDAHPTVADWNASTEAFALGDLAQGTQHFHRALQALSLSEQSPAVRLILDTCVVQLEEHGAERVEYLLLALDTLETIGPIA